MLDILAITTPIFLIIGAGFLSLLLGVGFGLGRRTLGRRPIHVA